MFGAAKKLRKELDQVRQQCEGNRAIMQALDRSLACIEFDMNGNVLDANSNFLRTMGYDDVASIRNKHHRIFCSPEYATSRDYDSFWRTLAAGEFYSGKVKRKDAKGRIVWLQATYNPILDESRRVKGFIKFATDITQDVRKNEKFKAEIAAIDRVMARIHFRTDGTIEEVNENFLSVMGYQRDELLGKQHRMFCDARLQASPEYEQLWSRLRNGEFYSGRVQRVNRQGKVVWLEASYNPVFDEDGKICQVVKFATDITREVERQLAEQQGTEFAFDVSRKSRELCELGVASIRKSADEIEQMSSNIGVAGEHIQALGDRSHEISAIVNTIKDIADQTNLLALNAAIEAARAGEMGRGFAVVADEVRSLAGRTSTSTAEITRMVTDIQSQTQTAVKNIEGIFSQAKEVVAMTQSTGSTMEEIRSGASSVVDAINQLRSMNAD